MQLTSENSGPIQRRAFLRDGALVLSAGVASSSLLQAKDDKLDGQLWGDHRLALRRQAGGGLTKLPGDAGQTG